MHYLRSLPWILLLAACTHTTRSYDTWEVYGGSKENLHYSSLTAIDTNNVTALVPAWTFHTGDADTSKSSQMQCNPIIVDSVMYVSSPTLRLFAIHAGTGRRIWEFNPDSNYRNKASFHFILNNNRGVTYWTDGNNDARIFFVAGSLLHCIDARTGRLISDFGNAGIIDLHDDLGRNVNDLFVTATTPGVIYRDMLILGSRVDEGPAAAPGHIRAFDVKSGKLKWIFHTIPQPGEFGYDTWEDPNAWKSIGGANSWSGFALDEKRGLLFAPTGSASFDFYGGKRKGQNLFANCLLALDAATGKYKWHFQFVHHDVWDMDIPCPPALVTVRKDGKNIDAVAQLTKFGTAWLFDRETGKPLYPVNEVPVDTTGALPGEKLWPTQPMSTFSKPYVRQTLSENDINPYLPDSSIARIREQMRSYNYGKVFIVPSTKTRVQLPGLDGGSEWGGPSVDPETGVLYANANEMAWLITMYEIQPSAPKNENNLEAGTRLYKKYCITCHGPDRKGAGNYPSLITVNTRYTAETAFELLNTGRRMMPSFQYLSPNDKKAILSFVLGDGNEQRKPYIAPKEAPDSFRNLPYGMTGYYKFLSPEGRPAISPPWGTLTAIDLNTGEHLWKQSLGEYDDLKAKGIPPTGTENYGSSAVTAGGLLFIAATKDKKLRAFNKRTGKLLWQYDLPTAAFSTPSVYQWNGKQYLVIGCGGGKLGTRSGDSYVAFALP